MARRIDEPGGWPDVSGMGGYPRLVALARRRLVGYEHLAEDVVSRSLTRWTSIPPDRRPVARIEQVIKSEAFSLLRSEKRARAREERVWSDPTTPTSGSTGRSPQVEDLIMLRQAISEVCRREQIEITWRDLEILELLFAGHSMSEVERVTGLPRHAVKRSRQRWRNVLTIVSSQSELRGQRA